jgi:hypothetical protein
VNDPAATEASSRQMQRATRYLRWYPSVWKARYGEEFVAHLEAELEERPMSVSRSLNIALHGVTARFRLQASVRWMSGVALTVVVVVALIAGVLGSGNRNVGVPLRLNTDASIGVPVSPKTVTNINFQFTDRSTKVIRITNVALIGFRDYRIPRIVRVQFDAKRQGKSFMINPSGAIPGLAPAFGRRILLGNGDSILVSMQAPHNGHLYAVDGLRLTYVHKGATHMKTLSLRQSPQLLCVEPHVSTVNESPACERKFTTAWSLAQFYDPLTPSQSPAQREAFLATNAAFDYVTGLAQRDPGLTEVREWATSLFTHRGSWRIVQVTAQRSDVTVLGDKDVLLFHFLLQNRSTQATKTECVVNGGFDSGGGEEGPLVMACHE